MNVIHNSRIEINIFKFFRFDIFAAALYASVAFIIVLSEWNDHGYWIQCKLCCGMKKEGPQNNTKIAHLLFLFIFDGILAGIRIIIIMIIPKSSHNACYSILNSIYNTTRHQKLNGRIWAFSWVSYRFIDKKCKENENVSSHQFRFYSFKKWIRLELWPKPLNFFVFLISAIN